MRAIWRASFLRWASWVPACWRCLSSRVQRRTPFRRRLVGTKDLREQLTHARGFYGVIALATLVGLGLNLLGINPITALVYTAIINGVVAVPLLVLILLVANNPAIMGSHTNGKLSNSIGIITIAAMGAAAVAVIALLF